MLLEIFLIVQYVGCLLNSLLLDLFQRAIVAIMV